MEGAAMKRWETEWRNLKRRKQQNVDAEHDRLEYLRERRRVEREHELTTPQAAQRLSDRGGAD